MKWCWVCLFFFNSYVLKSQTITTFAGCGASCTGLGDGGPAVDAVVLDPNGGTFDRYGNYYFTEATGQRVRKIDTAGIISTIAGTGSGGYNGDSILATSALLNEPSTVLTDTIGNLYISDASNFRIRKVSAISGIISTICGNGTTGFAGDSDLASTAIISEIQDMCFDKIGNLYIADQVNQRVRKINTAGIISTFAGNGGFSATGTGDNGSATHATFNFIAGLAADDTGNIYIADYNGAKVRKVNTAGIITTVAGNGVYTFSGDGIAATAASIAPVRLAINDSGNLIIADKYNHRIYKIDNSGIIHTIAGNGMTGYGGDNVIATTASLDFPAGISFDFCGNLYITDVNNKRIRKVTFDTSCSHSTLSIKSAEPGINISLYPNPATTELTISSNTKIKNMTITNILGQTAQIETPNANKVEVNIAALQAGVYLIKITDENGVQSIKKIIKE